MDTQIAWYGNQCGGKAIKNDPTVSQYEKKMRVIGHLPLSDNFSPSLCLESF